MDNSGRKRRQRIIVLTLTLSLLLNACGKKSHFEFMEDENNELVVMDDSYIDNDYIDNYYVLELYNKTLKRNEICIVRFDGRAVGLIGHYVDVFTNLEISVGYMDSVFECTKVTSLSGYLVSFHLVKSRYSYEDMQYIYKVIKENYVFENDSSLKKVRINYNIV